MRFKIVFVLFILFFALIISRLFYWQVIKSKDLQKQASLQYKGTQVLKASRGNILASDGTWLAVMRTNWLLFAETPKIDKDKKEIANLLAPLFISDDFEKLEEYKNALLEETNRIEEVLNRKGAVWVPIKRKLTQDQKEKIESLKIKGLGFEPEEVRYYPEGSEAAHLLGFLGKGEDGQDVGYFGLEGYYDIALSGKDGYLKREKDLTALS